MIASHTPCYCTCGHAASRKNGWTTTTSGCTCDYTCVAVDVDDFWTVPEDYQRSYPTKTIQGDELESILNTIFKRMEEKERRQKFYSAHVLQSQRHRQALANGKRRWINMPQSKKILPRTIHNAMMLARAKEN